MPPHHLRARRGLVVALAVATSVSLLGSCGVRAGRGADPDVLANGGDVIGSTDRSTTTTPPPTTTAPPPTDIEVTGGDGSEGTEIVTNAIADLQDWWAKQYPDVFDGDTYEPVSGGFYAYGSNTDPSDLPCAPDRIEDALGNAFYCPAADAVLWDQEVLLPKLIDDFGAFTVAVVVAHEWGHAIQARGGIDNFSTVILEQQSDCFAGAWVRHVKDDGDARFRITTDDLDKALAGFLSLRDAPGSSATNPNAHGSGFDRVRAFQEGYQDGAGRCAEYRDGDPTPFQFPFTTDKDLRNNGDLPLEGADGILAQVFPSIDTYWKDEFPNLSGGKDWDPLTDPVAFSKGDPPTCNGDAVTGYRLFVCIPDRYIAYDDQTTIPDAYDQGGDFAVAALFATQYGLDVQDQLGDVPKDEVTATLRGDCYAGSYAESLILAEGEDPGARTITLSPGDLDEAVGVLLSFRSDSDRDRQGPGFERVRAFGIGVTDGAEACADVEPS